MRRTCPSYGTLLVTGRVRDHRGLWMLMLGLTVTISGCGYGDVSPMTYEYAKALYSITNRKDATRLDQVKSQIEAALDEEQLSEQEADWLSQIIDNAAAGRWDKANRSARQIMEDQLK